MNTKSPVVTFIYTIFLGLLIALFFGLGVSAFYPAPKSPDYPVSIEKSTPDDVESAEQKQIREKYESDQKEYQKEVADYNRNVSMITLGFSVLSLAVGLLFLNKISLISDGLMLGGVFTLIYSIIRGFSTEDAKYRFMIVAVGLLITLVVGYIKFIRPAKES